MLEHDLEELEGRPHQHHGGSSVGSRDVGDEEGSLGGGSLSSAGSGWQHGGCTPRRRGCRIACRTR